MKRTAGAPVPFMCALAQRGGVRLESLTAAADTVGRVRSDRVRVQPRELHAEIATRRDPVMAGLREQIQETLAR